MHTLEIQLRLQRPSESCLWQQKDEESDGRKVVCTHTHTRASYSFIILHILGFTVDGWKILSAGTQRNGHKLDAYEGKTKVIFVLFCSNSI